MHDRFLFAENVQNEISTFIAQALQQLTQGQAVKARRALNRLLRQRPLHMLTYHLAVVREVGV